jgi:hypothetical protein
VWGRTTYLARHRADTCRDKQKIAEPFVAGHVDGRIGEDLFEREPLDCLHHLRAQGSIEPFCFQRSCVVGREAG